MRKLAAFTLLEIIVTLGIIGVITGPLMLGFANIRANHALNADTENLSGVFKQAHIYAREQKDSAAWGVMSTGVNSYRLLARDMSGTQPKGEFTLNSAVNFFTPSFEVWFNQGTGDVKNDLEHLIVLETNSIVDNSQTIRISPKGVIEVN